MHSKAMWPMHGKYICPDCLREFPIAWEDVPAARSSTSPDNGFAWSEKPVVQNVVGIQRSGNM
jgi:hypothetical protein